MAARIGQFLLFFGLIALIIFFASDQAFSPAYEYLCSGLLLTGGGVLLMWRNRKPSQPSERFRGVRKMRDKSKK